MDPLERQIADAVNVDPSPEFVARVRARVATEGAPARWRMSQPLMASAAVAATLAIVVWGLRVDRVPSAPITAGQVQATAAPSAPAVAPKMPTRSETPLVRAARHHERPMPQVIVAASELKGLRQLSDLMHDGTVALTFDDAQSPSPPPVKEIVVPPIDIAPLTVASNWEQGDEQ